MNTSRQVDDWLREIEARPASAAAIIRLIASRLGELEEQNQDLLAENILLRSGKTAEQYENQLAALSDQLELLKRQLGGAAVALPAESSRRLLIYAPDGRVICLPAEALPSPGNPNRLVGAVSPDDPPQLQLVTDQDELIFVLDSGRVVRQAASALPCQAGSLTWEQGWQIECRGTERLAFVLSITRLPLLEFGLQASRRAFVRRVLTTSLPAWISQGNIGTGVLQPADRTFALRLAQKDQRLALASREGLLWSMDAASLPFMPEEAVRLSPTDHVVSAFTLGDQTDLLIVTQQGKVVHRDLNWLENARSFKGGGQSILSHARLEAGIRLAAAAAVHPADAAALLLSDGSLCQSPVNDLLNAGSLNLPDGVSLCALCVIPT